MSDDIYNSKVIGNNGEVFMDITSDTVSENRLLAGYTAHDRSGRLITGTCGFDINSSDATASPDEVISGETFAANGQIKTGTMPNIGAVNGSISEKDQQYAIPMGFHDGSGRIGIDETEKAKIIPGNIKRGITLLGVTGAADTSSDITAQTKSVTPAFSAQVVLPDEGTDYLSQVNVAAIPVTRTLNSAGGYTVTIGG